MLFSFAASGVYLINDIMDLESDKKHPIKRLRPLVLGRITIPQSRIASLILISIAISISFIFNKDICWIIASYIALNLLYTKIFKNIIIVDVACIGIFYYFRIMAGSLSSNIVLSNWIIVCTVLLALFLALGKRRYDLKVSRDPNLIYRKHNRHFINRIISIICAAIVIAYALYTLDQHTIARFGTNHMIYTIPFVYYGIFRYLYLIDKKGIDGDPTLALLKDRKMQFNLLLW
ncbi:MAG: UbiA prenyltransferase family protein, partial [Candidatus Omnitrophota bacterium]|nr:UbiA prenyltransferase family protein [Candidatus Omnitrophota bacterium]